MSANGDRQIERLERLLGRSLSLSEESCDGFEYLTQANLDEIKSLAKPGTMLDGILLVRFFLGNHASLRNAASFVDNVGAKDMCISEWIKNFYHRD